MVRTYYIGAILIKPVLDRVIRPSADASPEPIFTVLRHPIYLEQFFPSGVGSWMAKMDTDSESGGLVLDERFFPHGDDWRGLRPHQTRLQGGDASSDSYCYR